MAAPRATQFIALRNLARGTHHVRTLHMTGPATYASPALTNQAPILNLPRDIASLRAECKRRKIEFAGSKHELVARLNAHELSCSRPFSTAALDPASHRPTLDAASSTSSSPTARRHLNTSRALKAVHDTSTIDFAFLPAVPAPEPDSRDTLRVPIIPTNFTPRRTGAHAPESADVVVMKPEVSSMSADAIFLPMSDLHDGHAMDVDFHAMADTVAASLRRMKVPVEEQAGMMKQIWNDMVDDMIGAAQRKAATS